ncbi:hypothetical protein NBRC10512_000556 [Rhodotorula toruloides]|uniref:Uncharacterized protein n=1 Tax=Rhodotorula toruloides (strain NP11) TaxID=1130832 RepID=M7XIH4_RHOT1|nr:uncharacterized protein RHTO_03761 [Rhodotorula toruloides NP11]EMS19963.1 hypothetical protein RHTO_03761 [Rhodotorula toruloides NP11]
MFSLSSNGHSRRLSLAGIRQSSASPAPSADSTSSSARSDASSPAPRNRQSTHARRRSVAITRDLFADGSRDAVRCRPSGMDGLEELLAMEPPPPRQVRRASEQLPASQASAPAFRRPSLPTHSLAWPATAPTPLLAASSLSSASPSSALSPYTLQRRSSASTALDSFDLGPAPSTAPSARGKSVKRKPVPALALEEEVETVADPCWDGSVPLQGAASSTAQQARRDESSDEELLVLERVRKMSVEDGGLGIGLPGLGGSLEDPGISAASFPLPPLASPISSVYTSTTASLESSALSRTTSSATSAESSASSVPSASASSSSRPFALVKKQHAKPTVAHDIIFGSTRQRVQRREEDLLDAWMDVIVGDDSGSEDALPFGRTKRPAPSSRPSGSSLTAASLASVSSLSAPTPRPPPASFAPPSTSSAPPQLSPDALAELASSLPPLMYAAPVSSDAPVAGALPSPPLSASGAVVEGGADGAMATDAAGRPGAENGTAEAAPPSRLSILADEDADACSDDTHGASDAFYDAEEEIDVPATSHDVSPSIQSLPRKRPVLEIASPPPSPAHPLPSPTSPTHPEPKGRLVSSSCGLDKPLPPRPPKSSRRGAAAVSFSPVSSLSDASSTGSGELSHLQERRMPRQVAVA